jgi:phytanoyl-CoA hydroxylase
MRSYFQNYEDTDLLEPQTTSVDGIFNSSKDPLHHGGIGAGELPLSELEVQKLITSHQLQEYLRLLEHYDLRQMVRDIMGWEEEILLRRTMLRHNVPGGLSTGIHYDKLFLRDGGAYFLTAWVPLGKAPPCSHSLLVTVAQS